MNNYIKNIVETVFDDKDIFYHDDEIIDIPHIDDINEDLLESLLYYSSITRLTSLKELYKFMKECLTWENLINKSNGTLNIDFLTIRLIHNKDLTAFSKDMFIFFDKFLNTLKQENISLTIYGLNLQLENIEDNVYKISDFIDLNTYDNINIINFYISYVSQLEDLSGVPSDILALVFININKIKSFKYFPKTNINIQLVFDNCPLPDDWIDCPNNIDNIDIISTKFTKFKNYTNTSIPDIKELLKEISWQYREFKNIPTNLILDKPGIISAHWNSILKNEILKYIKRKLIKLLGNKQYKNVYFLFKKRK